MLQLSLQTDIWQYIGYDDWRSFENQKSRIILT